MIHMTDHLLVDGRYFAWHRSDMEQNYITSPPSEDNREMETSGQSTGKRVTTFVRMTGSSLSKPSG